MLKKNLKTWMDSNHRENKQNLQSGNITTTNLKNILKPNTVLIID